MVSSETLPGSFHFLSLLEGALSRYRLVYRLMSPARASQVPRLSVRPCRRSYPGSASQPLLHRGVVSVLAGGADFAHEIGARPLHYDLYEATNAFTGVTTWPFA